MGGQGRKPIIPLFSPKRYRKRCALALSVSSQAPRQGRVAAPSVCFAVARILLAAAPTAPPCFRHWRRSSPLPQRGSPWHVGQLSSGRAKHNISEAAVLRCLGQRQLDKARLSRNRCPRKQGPPFCALSGLGRPVGSGPACQWLPLWGQRRRPPPVAETGRSCWGRGQQDASDSEADAGSRNPALASESETERASPA